MDATERAAELAAMTSEDHRLEAIRWAASLETTTTQREHILASMRAQRQWHATMALVEQGRGR
jgi:hypothetical protein